MRILEEGPATGLEIYGDKNGVLGIREVPMVWRIEIKEEQQDD